MTALLQQIIAHLIQSIDDNALFLLVHLHDHIISITGQSAHLASSFGASFCTGFIAREI